jgi:hypothetical protein
MDHRGGMDTGCWIAKRGSDCGWREVRGLTLTLARGCGSLCLWRLRARPPDITGAARNERRGERAPQPEGVRPGSIAHEEGVPQLALTSERRKRLRGEGLGRRTHL